MNDGDVVKGTRINPRPRIRWVGMIEMSNRYGNVSASTIRRWSSIGVLPEPVIIGGLLMWDEAALDAADDIARANATANRAALTAAHIKRIERANAARGGRDEDQERATLAAAAEAAQAAQEPAGPSSSSGKRRGKASMTS